MFFNKWGWVIIIAEDAQKRLAENVDLQGKIALAPMPKVVIWLQISQAVRGD